ncbi:MAG TPA: hotdog fold thioesterase [Acidimicrobiia bacterium]|nr:hotdog fold thioesterase [Acidimicrobiia bacterium]
MIDGRRVSDLLSADQYASGLGIELVEVTEGSIVLAMDATAAMTNFHGGMHGGALFSLADCAFSLYSNSYGAPAVAIDTHMVFSAAIRPGERLRAVAEEVHRGRTLATYRVLVHRGDGRVAGHFTGTVYISA